MVGADPPRRAQDVGGSVPPHSDLTVRVVAAVALAPLPILAAMLGGWPFVMLCALAAIGIWWEWATLAAGAAARLLIAVGAAALAAAAMLLALDWTGAALAVMALGAALVAAQARRDHASVGAGVVYAGIMLAAPVVLRRDAA